MGLIRQTLRCRHLFSKGVFREKAFPAAIDPRLALAAGFQTGALAQDKPLKIGVTAGPHAQIFEQVKKVAEKDGLKLQIVEFSDYVQPNAALASGDLDANSYQHKPYLDAQVKELV